MSSLASASTPPPRDRVTVHDVEGARARIADAVVRTPLLRAAWAPGELWLKAENLQPTGAFKIRGAVNAIRSLGSDHRARGVVTHSSGNHGQAVAWAARELGIPAVIVVPDAAITEKVAAIRELGSEIRIVPAAEREAEAARIAAEREMTLIPPFDDAAVIAGQGTLALEFLEDLESIDTVLVPIGGGGLISGVAVAVKSVSPSTRVIGVEPELAADARDSLSAGHRISWDARDTYRTVADGVRVPMVGELNFPLIQAHVDEIVTVDEHQILSAVGLLSRKSHLIVEPSGALSVAAALMGAEGYGRTVAVLSGGNIGSDILMQALSLLGPQSAE